MCLCFGFSLQARKEKLEAAQLAQVLVNLSGLFHFSYDSKLVRIQRARVQVLKSLEMCVNFFVVLYLTSISRGTFVFGVISTIVEFHSKTVFMLSLDR